MKTAAQDALADVTCSDDGVILFLTAHTKRGQQWLDRSTGMHYGAAERGTGERYEEKYGEDMAA